MRRAESARLLLMDALMRCGSGGATREDLMHLSGLSQGAFYKNIAPLLKDKSIRDSGDRYTLPMSVLQNYRFKIWRDSEQLRELPTDVQACIEDVVLQARELYKDDLEVVWLVGSAAHGDFQAKSSDLDFMLVTRRAVQSFNPRTSYPVQLAILTAKEFERRIQGRDSFCLGALRYGVLLEDQGLARIWLDLPCFPELSSKPIKEIKESLEHLRRQHLFFLKNEAREDAEKSIRSYAITLGRALLAAFGELPMGKPDLLKKLAFYYSKEILPPFVSALENHSPNLDELEEIWNQFRAHFLDLKGFERFLFEGKLEFSISCAELIKRLPGVTRIKHNNQTDWAFQLESRKRLYVECRSTFGDQLSLSGEDGDALHRFCNKLLVTGSEVRSEDLGLIIFNPLNKRSPLLRAWELADEVERVLSEHRIIVVKSWDLLSFYSFWRLTGRFCDTRLANLFCETL